MVNVNDIKYIKLGIRSYEEIISESRGELKNNSTYNFKSQKPEFGGLFCERIFGPSKDFECNCGKYKGREYKGVRCEKCQVEVTTKDVRRERTGHITLAFPFVNPLYLNGMQKYEQSGVNIRLDIGVNNLFNLSRTDFLSIVSFRAFYVSAVNTEALEADKEKIKSEYLSEIDLEKADSERKIKVAAAIYKKRISEKGINEAGKQVEKSRFERKAESINRRFEETCRMYNLIWSYVYGEDFFTGKKDNSNGRLKVGALISNQVQFLRLSEHFEDYFETEIGAEFVENRIKNMDLKAETEALSHLINNEELTDTDKDILVRRFNLESFKLSVSDRARFRKIHDLVNAFYHSGVDPNNLIVRAIPVIPPELRPMYFKTRHVMKSDVNDVYRKIFALNEALKYQENMHYDKTVSKAQTKIFQIISWQQTSTLMNEELHNLFDLLVGKKGIIRQDLLGGRVDYSGRSVIVVGPELKMHQCGLPKQMALELFKPFVINELIRGQWAHSVKSAKHLIFSQRPEVWDVLENVIREHPVLLNRAPTLHRLGIQAYEPVLVEGNAIRLHPLACTAFNADFDGDQMAVHIPLSIEAQAEARILMLGANNILKPSDGTTIVTPSQDMIVGIYYLTRPAASLSYDESVDISKVDIDGSLKKVDDKIKHALRTFASKDEAQMAFDSGLIKVNDLINCRVGAKIVTTTLGRVIYNEVLPEDYPFVNETVGKKQLSRIIDSLVALDYPTSQISNTLDMMKDYGFKWASNSGVSVSYSDFIEVEEKDAIIKATDKKVAKSHDAYNSGMITAEERDRITIEEWEKASEEVSKKMNAKFAEDRNNSIGIMVNSGARGNWIQIAQIAGMRGLVSDKSGEIIPRPIKSNYREGLSILEYFIAAYGGRKGVMDTALKTADAGYFTRTLVRTVEDLIISEYDCGTKLGLKYEIHYEDVRPEIKSLEFHRNRHVFGHSNSETTILRRYLSEDIVDSKGNVIAPAGERITGAIVEQVLNPDNGVKEVVVRTPELCKLTFEEKLCAKCYGESLATGKDAEIGEPVGIISAQAVGEPGTQLTMRTFHTGGAAAAADITRGIPDVNATLNMRGSVTRGDNFFKLEPTSYSATGDDSYLLFSPADGIACLENSNNKHSLTVKAGLTLASQDKQPSFTYKFSRNGALRLARVQTTADGKRFPVTNDGDKAKWFEVKKGDIITTGIFQPKEVFYTYGEDPILFQNAYINNYQSIYSAQGVQVHDKNFAVFAIQHLNFVSIAECGDTDMLVGMVYSLRKFRSENERIVANGGTPAKGRVIVVSGRDIDSVMGGWIQAVAGGDTVRTILEKSIHGNADYLQGIREANFVGKAIPAGTGLTTYINATAQPTAAAIEQMSPLMTGYYNSEFAEFAAGSSESADGDVNLRDSFGV